MHGPQKWCEGSGSLQSSRSRCSLIDSPSSALCLLGEGVSWTGSRRVASRVARGARVSAEASVFLSAPWWLPDVFQSSRSFWMFSLSTPLLCVSPLSHISPPSFGLPIQFFLSSGITPFAKVLASPCLIVIIPRQINSRSPHLFSLFLFCSPLSPTSASFSLPHHSSFLCSDVEQWPPVSPIIHLDNVVFVQRCLTTAPPVLLTINATCMWF